MCLKISFQKVLEVEEEKDLYDELIEAMDQGNE